MRTYQGLSKSFYPIKKQILNEEWLCQLTSGTIKVLLNCKEYEVSAVAGNPAFFIVHDGESFLVADGSDDMELLVFPISHDVIVTLYPLLGSEANTALYHPDFVTSALMGTEITQMLLLDFQQLQIHSRVHNLLETDKLMLYLLAHLYLIFFNGIGRIGNCTTSQSFDIVNRLYELFNDRESLRHRDTQYFADKLHITVRYLFQVCKDETGHTPKELINDTILSEIRHVMLTTHLSFQQISIDFNFSDQTAFTQFFKRNTGMTPSEFRQRYK